MYYKHDKPIRYVKTCLTPIKNSCLWHFDINIPMIHVFLVLFLAFAFINTINLKSEKLIELKNANHSVFEFLDAYVSRLKIFMLLKILNILFISRMM